MFAGTLGRKPTRRLAGGLMKKIAIRFQSLPNSPNSIA
jgi:hypothetical protein